ncbi:putative exopolyphosphatase [Colletotrichum orbiculare MAFF 240422]|uniref:Exopolyphosphatase n=1 Tax=Colletotrichum orbiculare (strain 104-T / ATCC 96160 / CBS 514.97 / LARS 414 / MAFF 240422) TaxID=1213857 RepID=N4W3D2_COLOR|nr:putative exopolyphosphatase [Colletotrichum orbiculare MAFF 240422]
MSGRTSLRVFLANARVALTSPAAQRSSPLTLVVGNESADLDSLCSAVVYAYLRTHTPPHTLHIPVSNLPRDDLKLRPEMTAALGNANLTPSDLLTLDDLPSELPAHDTRWLLVDHNALTGDLGKKYSSRVVGCVDHHADEHKVPADTGAEPRVVEKCGSCASLVVEHLRSAFPTTGDDAAHLAKLALAPILIDTTDLQSKDKTTPKDASAAAFLEPLAGADFDRTIFYEALCAVKEDISALGFRDIFRKDYKQWDDQGSAPEPAVMGVSAVVQNLGYLVAKADGDEQRLLQEFKSWAEEKRLDIASIMTTAHPDGNFERDLLVWAFNKNAVQACKNFYKEYKDELGLEAWRGGALDQVGEGVWRMAWSQKNLSHSRKQVAPMLRDAIKGGAKI